MGRLWAQGPREGHSSSSGSTGSGKTWLRAGGVWGSLDVCFLPRNKFVEFDMKPVCKRCYEKLPLELKKRLKRLSELAARKANPKSVGLGST